MNTALDQQSDAELVLTIRNDDSRAAFNLLARRHYPMAYQQAKAVLGDWAEAEDVVQETFVTAYLQLDQLAHPERFAAWIRRIVYSNCMMTLRRRPPVDAAEDTLSNLEDLSNVAPETAVLADELNSQVLSAVSKLPARYRLPLGLIHHNEFSYRHIATVLGLPLGTVQSLISRAKRQLKPYLAAYADDYFLPQ